MTQKTDETREEPANDRNVADRQGTGGGVGDVETAGETTAAATMGGEVEDSPVGADTLVRVEGDPEVKDGESGQS